jgi:hypothetical protein
MSQPSFRNNNEIEAHSEKTFLLNILTKHGKECSVHSCLGSIFKVIPPWGGERVRKLLTCYEVFRDYLA